MPEHQYTLEKFKEILRDAEIVRIYCAAFQWVEVSKEAVYMRLYNCVKHDRFQKDEDRIPAFYDPSTKTLYLRPNP